MLGFVRFVGSAAGVAEVALDRVRRRVEVARDDPVYVGADLAPRSSLRREAFDFGDAPLPGFSSPPPRRTGWERD